MVFYAQMPSPSGRLLLCSDGTHLTGLHFVGQKDCPPLQGLPVVVPEAADPTAGMIGGRPIKSLKAFKHHDAVLFDEGSPASTIMQKQESENNPEVDALTLMQADTPPGVLAVFRQACTQVQGYFSGRRKVFTIPLKMEGTPFQKRVWDALLSIPYGEFVSYGDVARAAGLQGGYGRAVGTAVGRNPVTIIIPCHRVLSGAGALSGYSGGLERKQALLELEGFAVR